MRYTLLLFLLSLPIVGVGQIVDSVRNHGAPIDSLSIPLPENISRGMESFVVYDAVPLLDCAHGHSCCDAGCSCCSELLRPQTYYSRIVHREKDVVIEGKFARHRIAMSVVEDKSPVQLIVKTNESPDRSFYSVRALLQGRQVRSLNYDWGDYTPFENGYELVFTGDDGHVLLSKRGAILEIDFQIKEPLGEGLQKVGFILLHGDKGQYEYQKFALADTDGKLLSPVKFDHISSFNAFGQARVKIGYREGVITTSGEFILPVQFHRIRELENGIFVADNQLYSAEGERIHEETFGFGYTFSEGLIPANRNDTLYYMGSDGSLMRTDFSYGSIFSDGLAAVSNGEKYGFINRSGELVIPLQFDRFQHFHNGIAPVALGRDSNKDVWGLIDKNGRFVVEPVYDEISEFRDGLCIVGKYGEGQGFMNTKGKLTTPMGLNIEDTYHINTWFPMGISVSRGIGKEHYRNWSLIDEKGKSLQQFSGYTSLRRVQLNQEYLPFFTVYEEGYGLIDLKGNTIIAPRYEGLFFCDRNHIWLKDTSGFYSYDLNEIVPIIRAGN